MFTLNVQFKNLTSWHKMSPISLIYVPPVDALHIEGLSIVSILRFSVILDHDRLQSSWDVTKSSCYGLVLTEI